LTWELFEAEVRKYAEFEWLTGALKDLDQTMTQDGGHDYGHLLRVLCNARKITDGEVHRGEVIDWEVVVASVIFHDVINLPKNAPNRHEASTLSAKFAAKALQSWFDANRLALITEAIQTHSFSSGLRPQSNEAKIVTDADRLESLGAFGIARTFYVSGRMEGAIVSMMDPFAIERALDDRRFAVDHFFTKLLHLRDLMVTPTGREMAGERHLFLESFLRQLTDELGY
jgi:uncharacterized protein